MKNKKLFLYIKNNFWACLLLLIFIIQFLLIALCNIKLIDNNIDCDTGKLFVHIMKMAEHNSIIIPNWSYVSTFEIDCSSLLALPIYKLTNDIYLSFGIANIIFLAGLIGIIFFLFKDKNIMYPLLTANLFCIPYSVGMLDYFNMLFFGGAQYIIKGTLPLFLIAIILWCESTPNKKRKFYSFIPLALFAFFVFLNAFSSGIYVLFVGFFPVLVSYALYKILKCEKPAKLSYLTIGLTLVLSIAGIILNKICMDGGRGAGMILVSVFQIIANVFGCFAGIFELFGGISHELNVDVAVLSPEGVGILLKAVLVHTFIICGIIGFIKILRKKADLRLVLLLSIFIWNMFVLLATKTQAGSPTYEYRYHIIGMLPLICASVIILLSYWNELKIFQKRIFATTAILVLVCINVLSFPKALDRTDKQAELKVLCAYCDQLDVDYVYLYDASNDADMCRLITQDDAHYLFVGSGGTTWAYDYYETYVGGPVYSENAILVVDNRYDFGDSFESFGYKFEKFDTVANRTLYYFSE